MCRLDAWGLKVPTQNDQTVASEGLCSVGLGRSSLLRSGFYPEPLCCAQHPCTADIQKPVQTGAVAGGQHHLPCWDGSQLGCLCCPRSGVRSAPPDKILLVTPVPWTRGSDLVLGTQLPELLASSGFYLPLHFTWPLEIWSSWIPHTPLSTAQGKDWNHLWTCQLSYKLGIVHIPLFFT